VSLTEADVSSQVLGVIGWSGSGKTTLLEYLVGQLAAEGFRINIIKHSHHDIVLEPPHKDSARLRMAGAAEVMIASPYRFAIQHELRDAPEPSLEEHLARLAPADLTLVEGYKWAAIPKLEVFRPELGRVPMYPEDAHVVAVAANVPGSAAPGRHAGPAPAWLDLNQPVTVLHWLKRRLAAAP
jgi:molybdopterin-guanine dinucleotide biosynthesis protein B